MNDNETTKDTPDLRSLVSHHSSIEATAEELIAALDRTFGKANEAKSVIAETVRRQLMSGNGQDVTDVIDQLLNEGNVTEADYLNDILVEHAESRVILGPDGEVRISSMLLAPLVVDVSNEGVGYVLSENIRLKLRESAEAVLSVDFDNLAFVIDPKVLDANEVFSWTAQDIYDQSIIPDEAVLEERGRPNLHGIAGNPNVVSGLRYIRFWLEYTPDDEDANDDTGTDDAVDETFEFFSRMWVEGGSEILSDCLGSIGHLDIPLFVNDARHEGMTSFEAINAQVSMTLQFERTKLSKENLAMSASLQLDEESDDGDTVRIVLKNGAGEQVAEHTMLHCDWIGNEEVASIIIDLARTFDCVNVSTVLREEDIDEPTP
jgi:hypothetical protein